MSDVGTFDGNELGSERIKTGLDTLAPVGSEGDGAGGTVIGSDGDGITRGFTGLGAAEFEGIEGSILRVVGDATDVLEFKGLRGIHEIRRED